MKIGLFGFDFESPNKGCEALTYTFLDMIQRLAGDRKLIIYNFTYNETLGIIPDKFPNINFEHVKINLKNPSYWIRAKKIMKSCSAFFDATFGDGFSDIYGEKWNIKTDLIKQTVLWAGVPLVLVPQTYGPFKNKNLEKWAMKLIRNAEIAYSRDNLSAEIVKECCGYNIKVASDMAFKLPYEKSMYQFSNSGKIRIGINISSLLWDSEWAKENHFDLTVDYEKYHAKLIEYLLAQEKYEVHIIPHVIDVRNFDARENDYRVCLKMKERYGNRVSIAAPFQTPIEAKSYISNMDVFIGARMHATIGAISSGVATIPFSYSRKFEGLFGNLNYPYIISAKQSTTEEALKKTKEWIDNYLTLKQAGKRAVESSIVKLDDLENDVKNVLGV